MDCAQFDEILYELDRPGTKGAAASDAAMLHAESCTRCAERLTEVERLDFNLLRLKIEVAITEAPARVESALLQEFRRTARNSARRRVLRQVALLATAAVLLLAVGLSLRRHSVAVPAVSTSGSNASVLPPAARVPAPPSPVQGTAPEPVVAPVRAENTRPALPAASQDEQPVEYATNFVPLPYADDSLADEGGAIVRVQISRSALASLGLPVMEGDGAERVQADLVLSADGTPQAIRFVSDEPPAEE